MPIEYSDWSSVKTFAMPDGALLPPSSQTATVPPANSDGDNKPPSGQLQLPDSLFSNPFFMLGMGALFAGVVIAVVMIVLRRYLKPHFVLTTGYYKLTSGWECVFYNTSDF